MNAGLVSCDASDDLDIPDAVRELRINHGVAVRYAPFWQAAVEGRIPATRVGKRWQVRRADLPAIAEVLGVRRPSAA